MIARRPKLSIIALILALLIAVLAVGCAFSGARQPLTEKEKALIAENQLSDEAKAEIEKAWTEYLAEQNYEAALTFCDLEKKQDGIRYYGSYEYYEDGPECHILFIPCTDSDTDTQYSPGGIRFTHRTPFVLVTHTAMDIAGETFHFFNQLPIDANTYIYDKLSHAFELHKVYETQFYGSVLKDVIIPNDQSGLIEVESTMLAFTGKRQEMSKSEKYNNDIFLGKYDGYLTVMSRSGMRPEAFWEIMIGEHGFFYTRGFNLLAIKDGTFYDLKELYENGLVSEESIAAIEEKYYEFFPECRNLFSKRN